MTRNEMKEWCSKKAMELWNMKLNVDVVINNKLKQKLSRIKISNNGKIISIEISGHTLEFAKRKTIEKVLMYELIKLKTLILNPSIIAKSTDHCKFFQDELEKYNIPTGLHQFGKVHQAKCMCCGKVVEQNVSPSKILNTIRKDLSFCCKAKLRYKFTTLPDIN